MEKPSVKFNFVGETREYTLVFDYNEFCDVEMETGLNLLPCIGGGGQTASQLRGFLYGCLKTDNPKILIKEAGELLNRDTSLIVSALSALRKAAIGEDEDEDEKNPPAPMAPTADPQT